jgi:uncharacterized membrane protein (DUF2068 family)
MAYVDPGEPSEPPSAAPSGPAGAVPVPAVDALREPLAPIGPGHELPDPLAPAPPLATEPPPPAPRRERALVLIIAYKLGKGCLWLVFAAIIVASIRAGLGHRLLGLADHLRHHSGAWSLALADLVVRAASRRGLWTITVALLADGTMSLLEGWALLRGHWWGPWLVVLATGTPLPLEVRAFVRHPHAVRAALVVVNLAIVIYLARKAVREREERRAHLASAPK